MPKRSNIFNTVRTEGAILPAELLQRIVGGDATLEGLKPTDYHLSPSERLGEAATRSWNRLIGVWQTYRDIVDNLAEEAIDLDRRLNLVIPAIAIAGMAMAPVGDFESNLLYLLAPFLFPLLRRFA